MIPRLLDSEIVGNLLAEFPVTALLGPRQCGKTTLAQTFSADHEFDLENPRDLARLEQPQLALEGLSGLIVIDEIQRMPELFPLLRYLVDTRPEQRYLILGSASRELVNKSSESLAGRIGYHELGGLQLADVGDDLLNELWFRGGMPRSFTAETVEGTSRWLSNYIMTFLERDIPQLGISIPAPTLHRFWRMLSHYHGQVLNYSELSRSFGISDMTVRSYIDVLAGTYMVRILQPWHVNMKKRLIKRPKIYLTDSGILHSLLQIDTLEQLQVSNKLGASWEGFALETTCRSVRLPREEASFWGTHTGAEVDLFWQRGGRNWAVEFKYTDAPTITKSMRTAVEDLDLAHLWVVYPAGKRYPIADRVSALPLIEVGSILESIRD